MRRPMPGVLKILMVSCAALGLVTGLDRSPAGQIYRRVGLFIIPASVSTVVVLPPPVGPIRV